jgi:hypothetical protein
MNKHLPTTTAETTLTGQQRRRLQRRIAADLAQIKGCQAGEHRLEATKSRGVLVCRVCHTIGVCLWCGVLPPAGAVIVVCPAHRDFVRLQALALGASPVPLASSIVEMIGEGPQQPPAATEHSPSDAAERSV